MGYRPRGHNKLDTTEQFTLAAKSLGVPSSSVSLITGNNMDLCKLLCVKHR